MNVKKMLLLASMALASMAFALPATASAFELEGEGEIPHTEIALTGTIETDSLGRGIKCTVHATLTTEGPAATTFITKFEITTNTCAGFGDTYNGCTVGADQVTNLPWGVDIDATALTFKKLTYDMTLGNCGTMKTYDVTTTVVTATADNKNEIHSFALSGTATVDTDVGTVNAAVKGSLEVGPAHNGKIKIV